MNILYPVFVSLDSNPSLAQVVDNEYASQILNHASRLQELGNSGFLEQINERQIPILLKKLKQIKKQTGPRKYQSIVEHSVSIIRLQALRNMVLDNLSRALTFLTYSLQFFESLGLQNTQSYLNLQLAMTICQQKRGFIKETKQRLTKMSVCPKFLQTQDLLIYKFHLGFLMSIIQGKEYNYKMEKQYLLQCCCLMGQFLCKLPRAKREGHRISKLFCLALYHLSECQVKCGQTKNNQYCKYHCRLICNSLVQTDSVLSLYINQMTDFSYDICPPNKINYPHLKTLIFQIQINLPKPFEENSNGKLINLESDKLSDLFVYKKIVLEPIKQILKPQKMQELKEKLVTGISHLMLQRQNIMSTNEIIFNQSQIDAKVDQLETLKNQIEMVKSVKEGISYSGQSFINSLKLSTQLQKEAKKNRILRMFKIIVNVFVASTKFMKCIKPIKRYQKIEKIENKFILAIYFENQMIFLESYGIKQETKTMTFRYNIKENIFRLIHVLQPKNLLSLIHKKPSTFQFQLETLYIKLKYVCKISSFKILRRPNLPKKVHKIQKVNFKISGYENQYTLFVTWQDNGVDKTTTVERIDNKNCFMYLDLRFKWVTDGIVTPNYEDLLTNILNNYWYSGCLSQIRRVQGLMKILRLTRNIRSNRKFHCFLMNKIFLVSQYCLSDGRTTSVIQNLTNSADKWVHVEQRPFLPSIVFQELQLKQSTFTSTNHLALCIKEYIKQRIMKCIFQKLKMKVRSKRFQRIRSDEFWKKFEIYSYQSDTKHIMFLNLKPTSMHIYSANIFSCSRSFKFQVTFNVSKPQFTYLVENSHKLGQMLEFEANNTFRKLYTIQSHAISRYENNSESSMSEDTEKSQDKSSMRNLAPFKSMIMCQRSNRKTRTIYF